MIYLPDNKFILVACIILQFRLLNSSISWEWGSDYRLRLSRCKHSNFTRRHCLFFRRLRWLSCWGYRLREFISEFPNMDKLNGSTAKLSSCRRNLNSTKLTAAVTTTAAATAISKFKLPTAPFYWQWMARLRSGWPELSPISLLSNTWVAVRSSTLPESLTAIAVTAITHSHQWESPNLLKQLLLAIEIALPVVVTVLVLAAAELPPIIIIVSLLHARWLSSSPTIKASQKVWSPSWNAYFNREAVTFHSTSKLKAPHCSNSFER